MVFNSFLSPGHPEELSDEGSSEQKRAQELELGTRLGVREMK